VPNTPASPPQRILLSLCPLTRQSYVFVKSEFHLHLRQVFYLFLLLFGRESNECLNKKRKKSPELPLKKEHKHEHSGTNHMCGLVSHHGQFLSVLPQEQQEESKRACSTHTWPLHSSRSRPKTIASVVPGGPGLHWRPCQGDPCSHHRPTDHSEKDSPFVKSK
jgi:hypothetical protein